MPTLLRDWNFAPSRPSLPVRLSRLKRRLTGRRPFPEWRAIVAVDAAPRWNCLFLFAPDGRLSPVQRHTLTRVRTLAGKLMVVVATKDQAVIPPELHGVCDAIYWKAPGGFDFSAYAIALHVVATASPGADLYLQNDSVLGPLNDVDALLATAPWRLTGFLASATAENHLQSYALFVRAVTPALVMALRPALDLTYAYDRWQDVVALQETRLSRIAARTLSVGALWYAPDAGRGAPGLAATLWRKAIRVPVAGGKTDDPSLVNAIELVESGFPFLKQSLLGRNAHLQDRARIGALIAAHGYPEPGHD